MNDQDPNLEVHLRQYHHHLADESDGEQRGVPVQEGDSALKAEPADEIHRKRQEERERELTTRGDD